MARDVYFGSDLARVLASVACSGDAVTGMAHQVVHDPRRDRETTITVTQGELLEIYQKGVRMALISVGLAFGLQPTAPSTQEQVPSGQVLLWEGVPDS
jgi:hypothetical protein